MNITYDTIVVFSTVLVIIVFGVCFLAALKDGPSALGAAGVIIAVATAAWWPSVPLWVSFAVVLASSALFTVGIRADQAVDRRWHVAAAATGLVGRSLVAMVIPIWGWLMATDHFAIPRIVWVICGLTAAAAITVRWWRHRQPAVVVVPAVPAD